MLPVPSQATVALLGFGNVGRAFVRYVERSAASIPVRIRIGAVADSSGGLFLDNDAQLERVTDHKESRRSLVSSHLAI